MPFISAILMIHCEPNRRIVKVGAGERCMIVTGRTQSYRGCLARNGDRMHEMAITQSVVDAVCEHAAGRRVRCVKLEIGALCAVVADSMQFCFELATQGTVADGASLDVHVQPGVARCRSCANKFELRDLILLCDCGSADVEVLAGREMKILSMEVS
jgi:hydrogenase nickel incorporation protein HypA/HybF